MESDFKGKMLAFTYAVIMFFVIPLIFTGFNWVALWGLVAFFELKVRLGFITFWLLFLILGTTIIFIVRYIATFISSFIVNVLSMICPIWYWRFLHRYTQVICILCVLFIMYGYINGGDGNTSGTWITGAVLLYINYALTRDIIRGLKQSILMRLREIGMYFDKI